MKDKKYQQELAALVAGEGCAIREITYGRHMKLHLATPAGPRLLVVSSSCSDWRRLANIRADLRRMLRIPVRGLR